MRPIQTPFLPFGLWNTVVCCWLSYWLNNAQKQKCWEYQWQTCKKSLFMCLSNYNINDSIQGLDLLKLQPANLLDHQNLGFIPVCFGWCLKGCMSPTGNFLLVRELLQFISYIDLNTKKHFAVKTKNVFAMFIAYYIFFQDTFVC